MGYWIPWIYTTLHDLCLLHDWSLHCLKNRHDHPDQMENIKVLMTLIQVSILQH